MRERLTRKDEPFLNFKFAGVESVDLGVYSITSDSVYRRSLTPSFEDRVTDTPGAHGENYFGTTIRYKNFSMNLFLDKGNAMTLDSIKTWLAADRIGELILPEEPYKAYTVKVSEEVVFNAFPLGYQDTDQDTYFYSGTAMIAFRTVGTPYARGLFTYREDLEYDKGYYYDSGLLYREQTPSTTVGLNSNANNELMYLYNPGTAPSDLVVEVELGAIQKEPNTFLKFMVDSPVSVSYVNVQGLSGKITIDFSKDLITTSDNKEYIGRIEGSPMKVSGRQQLMVIPSEVEVSGDSEYSIVIENEIDSDIVKINPSALQVEESMIGKFFLFEYNNGAKIQSINKQDNSLTLSKDAGNGFYTLAYPGYRDYSFVGEVLDLPVTGNVGDVVYYQGLMYTWLHEWKRTRLFSSPDDFKDAFGEIEVKRVSIGASIVDLIPIRISTGTSVQFSRGDTQITGGALNSIDLSSEIKPRYI